MNYFPSSSPDGSSINEVKFTKDLGQWFRYGALHFQNRCTKHRKQPNNISQSTSSTQQNYKRIDNPQKFHDNRNNNSTFPAGTLPFQASQQITSGDEISFSIHTIKCFLWKRGEKYSLKKKPDNWTKDLKSSKATIKIMETSQQVKIMIILKVPIHQPTNEED